MCVILVKHCNTIFLDVTQGRDVTKNDEFNDLCAAATIGSKNR